MLPHLARTFFGRTEAGMSPKQGGLYGTGARSKRRIRLAGKLAKMYCWREGDAMWFVLTGHIPPVRPLEVRASINLAPEHADTPRNIIPEIS